MKPKVATGRLRFSILLLLLILFSAVGARASHLFGADLYYTYVSGTTYKITLAAYGDCSGGSFPTLATSSPKVQVFKNGSTSVTTTLTLTLEGPGTEVSPVCASQLANTTCKPGGTVTGVTRYIYSATYNLNSNPPTAANWKFRFNGDMGNTSAGRSGSITNINAGTTTLEATLINTGGLLNSSPTYTTIPTPFFCANVAQGYNPGTVDPNSDSLGFELVSGLNPGGTNVTYLTGYTATAPLAVATGTLSASATTGQINFTPNAAQKSLVVSKVSEYRNGVLVGTSMREMTFVVLNTCNNSPPGGSISNTSSNVTFLTGVSAKACASGGLISFNINPSDPNADTVDVTSAGLPAGATFTITNNGTPTPTGAFSWNVASVAPGNYTFFLTFTDRGCPLSSKQTTAYTVTVLPTPVTAFSLTSAATCTQKAVFTLTPDAATTRTITISQGTTTVSTITGMTGVVTDSLAPGTYTLTTTDGNSCFSSLAVVIAPPVLPTATVSATGPVCFGGSNGSLTATGGNGVAPYQYALGTGAYGSSGNFTGLSSGSYLLHIKDANNCVKDTTVQVPVTPQIVPVFNFSKPPCNAFNSGVISVSATLGTSPYQYALNSGSYSTSGTFSGLGSGFYTIHIKDANSCQRDTVVLLPDSVRVKANVTIVDAACYLSTNGSVTLSAFGTVAPYQYAQGSGSYGGSGSFTGLAAGSYTFHIKDVNNCFLDTTLTVAQPDSLTLALTPTQPLCFGAANGSLAAVAGGSVPSYTYSLNGGAYTTALPFTGLTAGTYAVTVKDAHACTKTVSAVVGQPTTLGVGVVAALPKCNGDANGTLTISASGATPPYQYAIGTGAYSSSGAFTGLSTGTYTLHAKDANGCIKDTTLLLGQPAVLGIYASRTNNLCVPLSNGSVTLYPSGGTAPFQYALGSGTYGSSPVFTGLAVGTYTFHIKDTNECAKDTTISFTDSVSIHGTVTITDVTCYDSLTGKLVVTGFDGKAPYTFKLNGQPAISSGIFNNLPAGSKGIRILDSFGCQLDTAVMINQPQRIVPSVIRTQPLCFGDANGSITVNLTGGTPGYMYGIGVGINGPYGGTNTFTGLAAGPYTFRFKDANNCYGDTSVILNQPVALRIDSFKVKNALCNGSATGIITIYGGGGTKPYTYSYNTTAYQADSNLKNLAAGNYTLHIKDANGCQVDLPNIGVGQPPKLYFASAPVTMPTCEGFKDGAVNVRGQGGTQPYTYSADGTNFDPFGSYPGLGEGTYTFTVRDSLDCRHDTTIVLTGYLPIDLNSTVVTPVRCYGEKSGKVEFTANGGVAPLTFQRVKPLPVGKIRSGGTFDSLAAATYTFVLTDVKGCKKDTTIMIYQPDSLNINAVTAANKCIGPDNLGAISTAVTGGNPPYIYKWMWSQAEGFTGTSVANLPNGVYPVVVTDTKGCADTARILIGYDNCCTPFIPNAFTPNGDGQNDRFRVRYKGDMTLQNLSIYNRFGQRVFVSANASDEWDGTFEGNMVDGGTYFYYIKILCGKSPGNTVEFRGDLTVIR